MREGKMNSGMNSIAGGKHINALNALSLILAASMILSACAPVATTTEEIPPAEGPTGNPATEDILSPSLVDECAEETHPSKVTRTSPLVAETGLPYVGGVVLVTGINADDIDLVIGRVNETAVGAIPDPDLFDEVGVLGLITRLYSHGGGDNVWPIVDLILQAALNLQEEGKLTGPVAANPDWVTGTPWPVEGSPWPVEGSPWQVEGSPWSDRGVDIGITDQEFWDQWAWGQIGAPTDATVGSGTRVFVLDTSPFATAGAYAMDFEAREDFVLCVSHPEDIATLDDWAVDGALEQHGLAVAGRVRALAPSSEIHLVRVLDANASGDLLALLKGLALAMNDVPEEDLERLVVNMSLGFPRRLLEAESETTQTIGCDDNGVCLATRINDMAKQFTPACALSQVNTDSTLALAAPLCLVIEAGAIDGVAFVAAAGNDYGGIANLPAGWPRVLAVGASNMQLARTCYSNVGEVLAPGGEGWYIDNNTCPTELPTPPAPPLCDLDNIESCGYGVLTLALVNHSPGQFRKAVGFSFWTGTSFSTPMTTSLVAYLAENGVTGRDAVQQIMCSFPGSVVNFGAISSCFP
jgi:hypothetical protein